MSVWVSSSSRIILNVTSSPGLYSSLLSPDISMEYSWDIANDVVRMTRDSIIRLIFLFILVLVGNSI